MADSRLAGLAGSGNLSTAFRRTALRGVQRRKFADLTLPRQNSRSTPAGAAIARQVRGFEQWRRDDAVNIRLLLAAALSFLLSLSSSFMAVKEAHATPVPRDDEPPPSTPAPFVLPRMAHSGLDVTADWFIGRMTPQDAHRPAAAVAIARVTSELNVLASRKLYVGMTLPLASALPPDGGLAPLELGMASGRRTMLGNVEGYARAAFFMPTSLQIGLSMGVVVPTASFDRDDRANRSATDAFASLDPTNYVHFLPRRVTLRPAGDLRIVRGAFVFQGRHGIDIVLDEQGIDRAKLVGRLVGHVGYLARPDVELAFEAAQLYFFSSDERIEDKSTPEKAFAEQYRISDQRRSSFVVGPALRLAYRDIDIGAALVSNLGDPLSPASAGFLGIRLSLAGHVPVGP